MKKIVFIAFISFFILKTIDAQSNESAGSIMEKVDAQLSSASEEASITMHLINNKGKQRSREIKQYIKTDNRGNRSSLIRFHAPADVKGTGFLAIENASREDDQWLFLPALNRSRRISAADESDHFMGSDFTYEDLDDEDLSEFDYKLLKETEYKGKECWVIEAIPNNDDKRQTSGYSKREIVVRKDIYFPVKIIYYNKQNEKLKQLEAEDVRNINGSSKWRAYRMTVANLKTGHTTKLEYENYIIDKGLDDQIFSQRYLERPIAIK